MDQPIRPANSAILFKLQTAEGSAAVPSPTVDAVPYEVDSVSYNGPFRREASNEANGSLDAGAPLIVGQPWTVRFRFKIKGANAGYTSSVKPPHHQLYGASGMRGFFQAAIAAQAASAGSANTLTLGASFAATAELYTGMPLILSGGAGAGHMPLVTAYTAGRLATLSDGFSPALDATTLAAIPANWTYAWTSPADGAARATDHPCGTLYLYEDGTLLQGVDMRGRIDLEGDTARPGFGSIELTGTFVGRTDAGVPGNLAIPGHSAPMLVQAGNTAPAIQVNRKGLPISRWSLTDGGTVTSPEDPNTNQGFGAGQLGGREPMFGCDPLATLVATRNTLAEIAAFANYPVALRFGYSATNRWSLLLPVAQPVGEEPGTRGQFRSHDQTYQAIPSGKDAQLRDRTRILSFS